MRVAFCGASGTGKSFLASQIQDTFFGVPLCPVGSRSVTAAMGLQSAYDVDKLGLRAEFQRRLFDEKTAWENAHDTFVTDRTVFDNLVYSELEGFHREASELEEVVKHMSRYTLVVVCLKACFQDIGDDIFRKKDPEYHTRFEDLLLKLLMAHRVPFQSVTAIGKAPRAKQVLDFVRRSRA